jgi:hypothetical protein
MVLTDKMVRQVLRALKEFKVLLVFLELRVHRERKVLQDQ